MADKPCTVPECGRVEQLRRGMCRMHYKRWAAHGDPEITLTAPASATPLERLRFTGWDVAPGNLETPCWEWRGSRRRGGYGRLAVGGTTLVATRVMYEAVVGPIPPGWLIRHKCDNPPCVNPEHLEPGTVRENVRDMLDRGRHKPPQGEKNGQAVLTEDDVREIRRRKRGLGTPYRELAAQFGVSIPTISMVVRRERWGHVDD